ncbi:MAG: trypsin-like peptidase domain-containing protein [Saprospiraceae bacterium]|nr:trypsin-like peptidase domain-containing protein [Saprospiraceae bacterium]
MVSFKFALGLGIITSLLISISTLFLYDRFFLEEYDMYTRNKAVAVAESDILFSDRFNKAFNSSQPNDFVTAAELSRKSVVFLRTKGNNDAHFGVNSGSGVILSNDGYIVTNHHVVKDAIKIDVTLNDNREFEARIIGVDPSTDLALLKIDAINLDYLIFGNSDSLLIGEWVMAVGNPFRLQSTVTAGIVSAKARSINLLENQGIESFIQTDAAVNPEIVVAR